MYTYESSYTTSPRETLQVLLDTHFPSRQTGDTEEEFERFAGNDNDSRALLERINEESVRSAITLLSTR